MRLLLAAGSEIQRKMRAADEAGLDEDFAALSRQLTLVLNATESLQAAIAATPEALRR